MTPADPAMVAIVRDGLVLVLLLSLPAVGAALLVGLVLGVIQSATQLLDPSIGSIPKLAAVIGVLALTGSWMTAHLVEYTHHTFELLAR